MSQPSFAAFIAGKPWLSKPMYKIASWYCQAAGYRQLGLRADDLIPEESETVLLALKRLDQKESYDRVYRLRRAFQMSLSHKLLPKEQWTKPEQDYAYLSPIIKQIEAEAKEKADLETLVPNRK
ncbi:ubiquinol-cytochrome c reductase complex 14 kDa protein-like protein [Calycina marina]|uniref:Cytochrome b-c1 complex subunit 7 n=1 Tax=Calycina marina TaxID=1763456 RepID=A0A9P7Z344_9HELO|nr:ubiquinol-cytochrome c reductase complex 14 kDa protein-like protein [Calycina marina]